MRATLAIFTRELQGYFTSPLAYVILAATLLINGVSFYLIVAAMNNVEVTSFGAPMAPFFGGFIFYWFNALLLPPVLAMRLVAEEVRSGTLETLMTAPVTDAQVVLGKYLAAVMFYAFLWAPSVIYVLYLNQYTPVDPGPVAAAYLGTLLIGALLLAAGTLASCLTRNQVVAAVLGFALSSTLFSVGLLEYLQPARADVWSYFNLHAHMLDFGKGVVDTRPIIYYVSLTAFLLFGAVRALERRRWS